MHATGGFVWDLSLAGGTEKGAASESCSLFSVSPREELESIYGKPHLRAHYPEIARRKSLTHCKNYGQRGVALIMALMLLLLLTALAAALVFVANMETAVNANYRREQVLYFAAKAGIEEARGRLLWTNATTLITPPQGMCAVSANHDCLRYPPVTPPVVPNDIPSGTNGGVSYILGGTNPAAVTPCT